MKDDHSARSTPRPTAAVTALAANAVGVSRGPGKRTRIGSPSLTTEQPDSVMQLRPSKDEIVRLIQGLPDDASLDDAIERLILIRKVETGLAQEGAGIPQSVAKAEFGKPASDRAWNRG